MGVQYGNKAALCGAVAPATAPALVRMHAFANFTNTFWGPAFASDCFYDTNCVAHDPSKSVRVVPGVPCVCFASPEVDYRGGSAHVAVCPWVTCVSTFVFGVLCVCRWQPTSRAWRWQKCYELAYFQVAPAVGSIRSQVPLPPTALFPVCVFVG